MFHIDLTHPIHVHFVGIGGISMSGLAEILIQKGFTISGSDVNRGTTSERLIDLGATIHFGHSSENISADTDLLVYTVAVKGDNPEIVRAKALSIPIIDRAILLGQIMEGYTNSIAIAGTHGKTTTTSMMAHVLHSAALDPTVSVGGILPLINGNIKTGNTDYFVTEACEYFNSYHQFYPKVGIVLNVEEDHLDFFKDIHEIRKSFLQFHQNIKEDGLLIINKDTPALSEMTANLDSKMITYSVTDPEADYRPKNIRYNDLGHPAFTVIEKGNVLYDVQLSVPGEHNIGNALSVVAASRYFGLGKEAICDGLNAFKGTHRRFQFKGSLGGVHVVDDYAHHPTEIQATIASTRKMSIGKLHILFQPHTYTRTKAFLKEFGEALAGADEVILMDIYSASRETDPGDIHSKDLKKVIDDLGTPCHYYGSKDEIIYHIFTHCTPGDLLITMGAGDVYLLGESLFEQ